MLTEYGLSDPGAAAPLQLKPNVNTKTVELLERAKPELEALENFTAIESPPLAPPSLSPAIFETWFPQPVKAEKATT